MPVTAGVRDPRSIITPDAFEVAPDLLGRPLATPSQRLIAILIDLAIIGFITVITKSHGLLLGAVAAALFIRAGFKRTQVRNSVFNRAMRLSVGCLGLFIGLVTAIGWIAWRSHDRVAEMLSAPSGSVAVPGVATGQLRDALSFVSGARELSRANNVEEARRSLTKLVATFRGLGLADDEIRRTVTDMIPKDADWSDQATALVDEALAATPQPPSTSAGAKAATNEAKGPPSASTLSTAQAAEAYAELLRSGAPDDAAVARLAALRSRLLDTLAADTLRALNHNLDAEKELAAARAREADSLRDAARKPKKSGGVFGFFSGLLNELGFGFGWGSIYLTLMTSWWKGQTVGKRLLKIRVLRLDGEPINWWVAFDRAGGYAAGVATGLLGFAQIFWDANRQCIHDRISGTVVVRDGAPKVTDWQEAV